MLAAGAKGKPKSSFLDYSIEDLNRITQLESIVTNYRNTLFDYQMHMVILGNDGSLYSVLDGVGNRISFLRLLLIVCAANPGLPIFYPRIRRLCGERPIFTTIPQAR